MLIKNFNGEERSHDQSLGLALNEVQEQALVEQSQLYISKFKPEGTTAYQQPPTSKGSTKYGAQRGANAQNVKLNEFGCLIGMGTAAGKQ